jgi:hypothetical protein
MYDFEVEISTRTDVGGGGRGPERDRGRKRRRPSLRNFGNSKLARICIICNLDSEGTPLLSDDGLVIFASLVLIGHFAQRADPAVPLASGLVSNMVKA